MFEKYYVDGSQREKVFQIEKHLTIEKSDAEFIYRPPEENSDLLDESTSLGTKYKKAKEICEHTQVVKLDEPRFIKKEIHEKSKSKASKKKTKRVHSQSNTTTEESI